MIESTSEIVQNWVAKSEIPKDVDAFLASLRDSQTGLFVPQESSHFDYKCDFPFSQSDDYFVGIVRLVGALHNTFGGVIVFGVHDEKRDAGHNHVKINVERFNTRLREIFSVSIECQHRSVSEEGERLVDLVLVPKRPADRVPVVLQKPIGKYNRGMLWFRRGHEVLEASSREVSFLFGPRHEIGSTKELSDDKVYAALPSNPSTIKQFVGRIEVLRQLFNWLCREDEPRKFLFGRGGSGKSTIGYEFARIIAQHGRSIPIFGGGHVEQILFLSAKEQKLNSVTGKIEAFEGSDFSDFPDLCRAILELSQDALQAVDDWTLDDLKRGVRDLLNKSCVLLVVDDIDTITTKGESGGLDFLFRAVDRSSKGSKILYTQRNAPTASLENSIEVPGLYKGGEYEEFVERCCDQFRQTLPPDEFCLGTLYDKSEGIPLIVETIIGLRRTSGSYEQALANFESPMGTSARTYLFKREYDQLPKDNRARHLLASLACFGRPAGNADLKAVLNFDDEQISDGLGLILEIFLSVSQDRSDQTAYSLNDVTKQFVLEVSGKLRLYPQIRERVKALERGQQPHIQEIERMKMNCNSLLWANKPAEALELLETVQSPNITEHPEFRALRGQVFSKQRHPKLTEARDDFEYCLNMKHESVEAMRAWANLEKETGYGFDNIIRICDAVIEGKTYSPLNKAEFYARKGAAYFYRADSERTANLTDAFALYERALKSHVSGYKIVMSLPNIETEKNYYYCRNTAFALVRTGLEVNYDRQVIEVFKDISKGGFLFDCLSEPTKEFVRQLPRCQAHGDRTRRYELLKQMKPWLTGLKMLSLANKESLEFTRQTAQVALSP